MTLDISEFTDMLKLYYTPRRVELLAYEHAPTLRLLSKRTDWTGDSYIMPIWHATSQAVGHDFTLALANKSQGRYERWELSRSKIYGFASIDRLAMKASAGDARSFLSAYTAEVDGIMRLLGMELSHKVFRTRAAFRGRIGAVSEGGGNSTVTLTNRSDHVHFHVGMKVVASDGSAAAGATPRNSFTAHTIDAIDRSAGTLTFTGETVATTSSWSTTNDDFLHRQGDVTTSSNTLGIAGFDEWVPSAAPGATSFYGVDRSVDTDKLGGIRYDGSGLTMEDAIIGAAMRAFEMNVKPSHVIMHPLRFAELIRESMSKLVRDDSTSQSIGVTAFKIQTPAGEQTVFADPQCQPDVAWMITKDSWELVSTGTLPEIFDEDLRMLRESTLDAYEVRLGGYGQLGCHYPGANVRIALT